MVLAYSIDENLEVIEENLIEAAAIYAPSGKEDDMCKYLSEKMIDYVDDIEIDEEKNFIAYKDNGADKTIVIDAHIDEIIKTDRDAQTYVPVVDGYKVSGKAMDDRAGVVVFMEVARRLKDTELNVNIVYLGAAQEEIGQYGAKYFVEKNKESIDYAFIVDVTWVEPGVEMGDGPALTLKSVPEDYQLPQIVIDSAKDIPYQISKYDYNFDAITTDALPYHMAGVDNAIFLIPITNMHTRDPKNKPETVDIRDIDKTASIIVNTIYKILELEDNPYST